MLTLVVPEASFVHIDVVNPLNPNGILFGLDVLQSFCERALFQASLFLMPRPPLILGKLTSFQATKGFLFELQLPQKVFALLYNFSPNPSWNGENGKPKTYDPLKDILH